MAQRIFASNDGQGIGYYTQQETFYKLAAGAFTTDSSNTPLFTPRAAGKISEVFLVVGTNATDATDTLTLAGDVKINTVSALTTLPLIAGGTTTAGTGRQTTLTAKTGVTVAAVNTAANTFAKGDAVTATPDTDYTDVYLAVTVTYDAAANV